MLPDVFFKKIEIIDSLGDKSIGYDNPHINENLDVSIARDSFNTRVYEQYSNAPLHTEEKTFDVTVTLDIDLKESGVLAELRSLFNEDLAKYVNVYLIQVADNEVLAKTILSNLSDVSPSFLSTLSTIGHIKVEKIPIEEVRIPRTLTVRRVPRDLRYILYSNIDFEKVAEDYSLDIPYDQVKNPLQISPRVATVIKDGDLVTLSTVFVDSDENIYDDVVYKDGEKFYGINGNELMPKVIYNEVIVDSRSTETLIQNFNRSVNLIENLYTKIDYNEPEVEIKRSYFSKNFLTTDKKGIARGAFSFDLASAIKDKSRFGWLSKSPEYAREIIGKTKINEIKIYRKRVKKHLGINSLNTNIENYMYFDDDVNDVKLIKLNDSNFRKLRTTLGVPTYTFKDIDSRNITDGYYIYSCHISMSDGSIEYLTERRDALESIHKTLKNLYDIASYNVNSSGYFNDYFKKYLTDFYKEKNINANYFAVEILDTASMFFNINPLLYNLIVSYMSKSNGSCETINYLIEFVEKVLNVFNELLPSYNYGFGNSLMSGGVRDNEIFIQEDLKGIFDSNIEKNRGVDYVEFIDSDGKVTPYVDTTGLNTIDGLDYAQRAAIEASKLYAEPTEPIVYMLGTEMINIQDVVNNSFAYLTPTVVNTPSSTLRLQRATTQELREADRSITTHRTVLSVRGKSTLEADEVTTSEIALFTTPNRAVRTDTEAPEAQVEQVTTHVRSKSPTAQFSVDQYNIENVENKVRQNMIERESPQIQALYAQGARVEGVRPVALDDVNNPDEVDYKYNYQMVNKIEFLSSYEVGDDGHLIYGDKWNIMTKQDFDQLKGEVICRMIPYDSPLLLTENEQNFTIYNKYFVIKKTEIEDGKIESKRDMFKKSVFKKDDSPNNTKYFGKIVTIK